MDTCQNNIKDCDIVENKDNTIKPYSTDIFTKYLYNIKNMETLNEEMINNIYNMTCEQKMSLIVALNEVIDNLKFLLQ